MIGRQTLAFCYFVVQRTRTQREPIGTALLVPSFDAEILVVPQTYYAVTDESGNFELTDMAPRGIRDRGLARIL